MSLFEQREIGEDNLRYFHVPETHAVYLDQLVEMLENETNPVNFMEGTFILINSLVRDLNLRQFSSLEELLSDETAKNGKEILETALSLGSKIVGSVYRDKENPSAIEESTSTGLIALFKKPYTSDISINEIAVRGRFLFDFPRDVYSLGSDIENFYLNRFPKLDKIVYVSYGGLEPALLVSSITKVEDIIPLAFSRNRCKERKVAGNKFTNLLADGVRGKNILVIDDDSCRGNTLKTVLAYLSNLNPKSLYAGVTRFFGEALYNLQSTGGIRVIHSNLDSSSLYSPPRKSALLEVTSKINDDSNAPDPYSQSLPFHPM